MLESAVSSRSPIMKTQNEKSPKVFPIMHNFTTGDDMMRVEYMRLFLYVDEVGLEDIITNQRIKLSCAWRTNDATEAVAQNETQRSDKVNEVGYICLSAICDSPAMWGYYADRARGACLVFDFHVRQRNCGHQYQILKNGVTRCSPPYWIQRIKYADKRRRRFTSTKNSYSSGIEENFDLLTTKSKDWRHEHEYRIFYDLQQLDVNDVEIIKDTGKIGAVYYVREILENLSGIILGVNASMSPQEVLTKIKRVPIEHEKNPNLSPKAYMHTNEIQVVRAKLHPTNFAYDIDSSYKQISIRHEDFINSYFPRLLKARWEYEWIDSIEIDLQAEILIDQNHVYTTSINTDKGYLKFYIAKAKEREKFGNNPAEYALFMQQGEDHQHYQYAYEVNPSFLKQLYDYASRMVVLYRKPNVQASNI